MACEAFWCVFGFGVEFQDAGDAFADVAGQCLVGVAVFVFEYPGGVFVLQDAASGNGFDAAMAACSGAGTGADIFRGLAARIGGRSGRGIGPSGCSRGFGCCGSGWLGWVIFRCGDLHRDDQRQRERSAQRGAKPVGFGGDLHSKMPDESVGSLSFGAERRRIVFFAAWREKATGLLFTGRWGASSMQRNPFYPFGRAKRPARHFLLSMRDAAP